MADYKLGEVLLIDKPLNMTSFGVVNKIRWELCRFLEIKKLKVGHAGTLDPLATGLVILCTGKKTKIIETFQAQEKEYTTTIKLGATTPSFDMESEEDVQFSTEHITLEKIQAVLKQFTGKQQQIPPIFSAKKINGKRAYTFARKGEEVKMKVSDIEIKELELISWENNQLSLRIVCSKGTYIRALARDIGKALESGGYLTTLRRTRIGDFNVSDAKTIENFIKNM